MGDLHYQADSLRQLGVTLQALGCGDEAWTRWREALVIFERLQSTDAEEVRAPLARPFRARQSGR